MNEKPSTALNEALRSQISVADEQRVVALISGDRTALEGILSDELVYVHSSGREETKELYINRILEGMYDYRSFVTTRRELRVQGDLVLDNGDADIDIVVNGTMREIASRFLMVWRNEEGNWRLFRFHGVSIARETTSQ
ncbi:nuclear transport factor 2 family protein [Cupriavidus necator]|uniref:Nuclear transport factor 2 family protein n=1 Tax=Cupriavidus necator TaxID=106590 RepID=A0A367PHV8_CUPNE|nr:nuclear transport factor 2 family protein [Cupriavidus necator]QQX86621.1 nuclear transport factor 2 family protein [Cupriavidus necator]RCJ06817.1 nuclear transport factor 2 family protein [Cupriavidus necator]